MHSFDLSVDCQMKLFKAIQKSGISRRKASQLILEGKVTVDSKKVIQPWHEVTENQEISIDGKKIKWSDTEEFLYYAFHKPSGYVTSLNDPKEHHIGEIIKNKKLKPVGRLDKDVSGLLILTNDGELIYKLTHPKYGVEREYITTIVGKLSPKKIEKIKKGIKIGNEILKCEDIHIIEQNDTYSKVRIIMKQGKKREIKRIFKRIGNRVIYLKRIRYGPVTIDIVPEQYQLKEITGNTLKELLEIKKKN